MTKRGAPAAKPLHTSGAPAALEVALRAHERENPERLSGQALRDLGHRRGMSRSEMERMPDEKLRLQLRILTANQYAEA